MLQETLPEHKSVWQLRVEVPWATEVCFLVSAAGNKKKQAQLPVQELTPDLKAFLLRNTPFMSVLFIITINLPPNYFLLKFRKFSNLLQKWFCI